MIFKKVSENSYSVWRIGYRAIDFESVLLVGVPIHLMSNQPPALVASDPCGVAAAIITNARLIPSGRMSSF